MQIACAMLYYHLWSLRLCRIFPHFLINVTNFGKKFMNRESVLIFSKTFVWNISHSKKN